MPVPALTAGADRQDKRPQHPVWVHCDLSPLLLLPSVRTFFTGSRRAFGARHAFRRGTAMGPRAFGPGADAHPTAPHRNATRHNEKGRPDSVIETSSPRELPTRSLSLACPQNRVTN